MKENEIKSIVVKADGNEIKVDHAHELVIALLMEYFHPGRQ